MSIWFGPHVADDSDLRLCGDLVGKRAIELGISHPPFAPGPNAIEMAIAGAKAIAVDPSSERIAAARAAAEHADVSIQCQHGDLADLGFATSASVDLVVAAHSLGGVDDLPRLLRQVHRVLKPGASFVVAMPHPIAAMFDTGDQVARRRYGVGSITISELYMSFERSNFHLDAVHELDDRRHRDAAVPSVMVLRARKLGV